VVSQLKLGRSYLTLRENLSLRKELDERKATERELRVLQRRLGGILNGIDEALLAVNEAEEITFCNRSCEALLGQGADALLGRPVRELLRDAGAGGGAVRRCLDGGAGEELGPIALARGDGSECQARISLTPLELDDEPICLLVVRDLARVRDGSGAQELAQSLAAVERINQNRARLRSIQSSLHGLAPVAEQGHPGFLQELRLIDDALERVGRDLLQRETHASRRHLAVEVMTCALECWTRSTGLTKADLATQTGLWRTYTNRDGWERTQTLDRYLRIETFPQRPAWSKVMRTADFVLSSAPGDAALRSRLEVLVDRLRASR
jgi:two-component system sensor histidine kinase ChiS